MAKNFWKKAFGPLGGNDDEEYYEDDLLDEAYVEHDSAKKLIAEIEAMKPSDEFYDAKVKVLSEMIKHHVKEEEMRSEGLFAEARDAGVNEFMAKPITARGVLERLALVIDHPRPFIRSDDYFGPDRRRRHDPKYAGPWRRASDAGEVRSVEL